VRRSSLPHAPARAPRWIALLAVAVVAQLAAEASAQATLVVNGVDVPGVTSTLVPGTAYAPAGAFAAALGARLDVDPSARLATLALGARLVQVRIVDDPARAVQLDGAITLEGRPLPGPAAAYVGVEPFLPVKAVGEALGAAVSFVSERNVVVVVSPRATVTARVEGTFARERLVLRASSPTRVTTYDNAPAQTLQLRFDRADVATPLVLEGSRFVRADVVASRGAVEVRVQLAPDTGYTLTEIPDGRGFVVVVAFGPASAAPVPTDVRAAPVTRVVLDPAHGGSDTGLRFGADSEASLTAALVTAVEAALVRAGHRVEVTRRADTGIGVAERSAAGTGATLFVSIHAADLPRGRLRLYHLGDAGSLSALEDAVRFNAETSLRRPETDGVRRQVLLDLVLDLDFGRRSAQALATELFRAGGYAVDGPIAAPLAVLAGAAGRGLLLEIGPDDLRDPSFAPILAATLATVLGSLAPSP
jgi:N-acetylmuramoyl-L-alanine amidase